MLKKTVTYTDYNGVERTEDFYFNLTRSELMEMHLTTEGGMDEKINSIIKAKSQTSDLQQEIGELSSSSRLNKIAAEQGLKLRENNIRTIR